MKIIIINETSPYLNEVIRLADENSSTLGFLPKEAFLKHAADNKIFVAVDENGNVWGYLLYGTNRRDSLVYITHLCVDQTHQGKGIARALFEKLKITTKHNFRGIRVRCRREYEATNLWPKLGFYVTGEMPGRSKHGSTLTVWWFDYGHPTLFDYAADQQTQSKLKVIIDANVFYDLIETPAPTNQLSHSLLADWLGIELCLTNEIRNEINRNNDPDKRKRARTFVEKFFVLDSPNDEIEIISKKLQDLFPAYRNGSDESDLRQIAKTIAADVQFFVTQDGNLLKKSEQVYERFGMRIIHPSDLIIHQDSLIRETEYQPSRLAGSLIQRKRIHSHQAVLLENQFRQSQNETKSEFRRKLQSFLAEPHTFEVDIIENRDQPLALIVYSRQNPDILEIPILRIVSGTLASTLVRHLIHNAISLSTQEGRVLTKVTDPHLSDGIDNALGEQGFALNNNFWVKANLRIVEKTEVLRVKLNSLEKQFPVIREYFQRLSDILNFPPSENNIQTLLQVEQALWPAKIADLDISTYIVSILPQWAKDLFDPNIANQTLFGADPLLMLSVENVYYRSNRTKLDAPARVLWYVSQGKGHFQGTMSIRACSYLDEIIIDKPKALFSRFKRLGVYTWEDVYRVAKEEVEQEIMAFRFTNTELFSRPIHRSALQEIWKQTKGQNFNVLSPVRISNDLFLHLYKTGLQI